MYMQDYNHTDRGEQTLGQILNPKLGGEMLTARQNKCDIN